MRRLSVQLEEDDLDLIDYLRVHMGCSRNSVVRQAVRALAESGLLLVKMDPNTTKLLDRAREAGESRAQAASRLIKSHLVVADEWDRATG